MRERRIITKPSELERALSRRVLPADTLAAVPQATDRTKYLVNGVPWTKLLFRCSQGPAYFTQANANMQDEKLLRHGELTLRANQAGELFTADIPVGTEEFPEYLQNPYCAVIVRRKKGQLIPYTAFPGISSDHQKSGGKTIRIKMPAQVGVPILA